VTDHFTIDVCCKTVGHCQLRSNCFFELYVRHASGQHYVLMSVVENATQPERLCVKTNASRSQKIKRLYPLRRVELILRINIAAGMWFQTAKPLIEKFIMRL
jgi:hypothetical protein